MLDIGWQEFFIVGALALIVVGPKDLPRALRTAMLGIRKVRGLARDFQDGVDEMVREANLDDLKQEMKKIKEEELERDLKFGVKDNTLGLDVVKDDLNRIARGDKENAPTRHNRTAGATESDAEPVPPVTDRRPARAPVKRKPAGSAKTKPAATPGNGSARSGSKKSRPGTGAATTKPTSGGTSAGKATTGKTTGKVG